MASGPADAEADPGYSALALSDAAADLTATQTWAVIDDEPPPSPTAVPAARRDWGSHAEDTGSGRQRAGDDRAAGDRAAGGRRDDSWTTAPRRGRRGLAAGPDDRTATGPGATGLAGTGPGSAGPGAAGRVAGPGTAAGLSSASGVGAAIGAPAGAVAADTAHAATPHAATGLASTGPAGAGLAGTERRTTDAGGTEQDAGALAGPGRGLGPGAASRTPPGGRAASRRGAEPQATTALDESRRGWRRGGTATASLEADSRPAPSGRRSGRRRRNTPMAALLLTPVLVVVLVVAGYVYLKDKHAPPAAPHATGTSHPAAARNSPAATLGTWKHIENRSLDPAPLTVGELFPATFSNNGEAGTLTVSKSTSKCSHEVFGSKLGSTVRKAGCTQVLRASYLSTDRKIMATIGVLNLQDATAAEKAGRAAGATEFIKQLASAHGPTRNIAKGTGIVEAEVKGHYLILTWTEFASLHAPSGKSQRQKLEAFSAGLVAGTANVSLTSRMVTGHPPGTATKS
jgi:hypothetical protein